MNDLEINNIKIEDMIYEIRGRQVMLDFDLAKLYQCKNGTKSINQAVKRHVNRFPERFMFQITQPEYYDILRSQIGTLELQPGSYSKYLPYAFTEQGVAMLATVLKTEIAEQVSISIMDAFVLMRKYIAENNYNKRLSNVEFEIVEHDRKIKLLQESFNQLEEKEKNNHLFFEGQIYDSYSLLLDLLNKADKEIIIIDNYAGKELFDILKDIHKKIKLVLKI